jgi:DNA repair exonuclease SbcCD ATPase subunit
MKPSKIEKYDLVDIVKLGMKEGKSSRAIAIECSDKAPEPISHTAVSKYMKYLEESTKQIRKDVVQKNRSVQLQLIRQDIDIIQLQYRTTAALLEKFETVANLPDLFDQRMTELATNVAGEDGADPDYLHAWKNGLIEELRRRVQEMTAINRELRENSKFLVDLREKVFQYDLTVQFIDLFVDVFRRMAPDACDHALQEVMTNPRMQRIVEMYRQSRGDG